MQITAAPTIRAIVTVFALAAFLFTAHVRAIVKERCDARLYASYQACAVAMSVVASLILSVSMPERMIDSSFWTSVAQTGWIAGSLSDLGNAFFIIYLHIGVSAFFFSLTFLLAAISETPVRERVAVMIFSFPGLVVFFCLLGLTIVS